MNVSLSWSSVSLLNLGETRWRFAVYRYFANNSSCLIHSTDGDRFVDQVDTDWYRIIEYFKYTTLCNVSRCISENLKRNDTWMNVWNKIHNFTFVGVFRITWMTSSRCSCKVLPVSRLNALLLINLFAVFIFRKEEFWSRNEGELALPNKFDNNCAASFLASWPHTCRS